MAPRTIDNLGVDASTRYATDQKQLDSKIIREAGRVPRQTEIDVTSPSFSSEFDLLFDQPKRNTPWARFSTPDHYNEQRKRLFTYQIIPSLGAQDKNETLEAKILYKIKEMTERQQKDHEGERKEKKAKSALELDEEKEKQILIKLLKNLVILDKCMIDINARRMQYQKG